MRVTALRAVRRTFCAAGLFVAVVFPAASASADHWDTALGGQLYDNWFVVLMLDPPLTSHPLYPADGPLFGPATWRCVACHGWDYRGATGASRFSVNPAVGPGIDHLRLTREQDILESILAEGHGFDPGMLPLRAWKRLAHFVSVGQVYTTRYIDDRSRDVVQQSGQGSVWFATLCRTCHGSDGKAIPLHRDSGAPTLGEIANVEPWRVLHKIRNGMPATGMVALPQLDPAVQAGILAYVQTLPRR